MKRVLILGLVLTLALSLGGCKAIHITIGEDSKEVTSTSDTKNKENVNDSTNIEKDTLTESSAESDSKPSSTGTSLSNLATVYVPDNGRTFMIPSIAKMKDNYTAEDLVRKTIELSNGAFDKQAKVIDVHNNGDLTLVNMSADFNTPEVTAMKIYCIINTLCSNENLHIKKVVFLINSHNVDYLGSYENKTHSMDKSYIKS